MQAFNKESPQTSFGAFKPVGNIVIVFEDEKNAKLAREELLREGRDQDDLSYLTSQELIDMVDDLLEKKSAIAVLGSELKRTDELKDQAQRGAHFLIVFAPDDATTENAMKTVESFNYRFALKYGHALIERFDAEHKVDANQ